jgi:hypothetical protein
LREFLDGWKIEDGGGGGFNVWMISGGRGDEKGGGD